MREFGRRGLPALTLLRRDRERVEHRRVREDAEAKQALHRSQASEPRRRGRESACRVLDGHATGRRLGGGHRHRVIFPPFEPLLKDGRSDRLVEGLDPTAVFGA